MESFGVMELCHIFQIAQPAMSHHLKILANADLVSTRREGNSIFYRRSLIPFEAPLSDSFQALFQAIDQSPLSLATRKRVAEIHRNRDSSSKQFFEKNADRLKQNQDLIAEFCHYAGCSQDLLNNENLSRDALVVEIGPAESPLLGYLSERFDHVIALDNSEEMLEKARTANPDRGNIAFHLGEISSPVIKPDSADLIALNMVLHHMASPAQFFSTAQTRLAPGGRLFVMDLCPHNQDWARDVCGDLWLGFEPADLDAWAAEAKLAIGQSAYIGLKNGFQVQLRLFYKPINP